MEGSMNQNRIPLSWVEAVCAKDWQPTTSKLAIPHTVEYEGAKYTVATSGWVAFLVPGDRGYPSWPVDIPIGAITRIFAPLPAGRTVVLLADLVRVVRDAMKAAVRECKLCEGAGSLPGSYTYMEGTNISTAPTCYECKGRIARKEYVVIGGIPFDARLAEVALDNMLTAGTETVSLHAGETPAHPLLIAADEWRFLWMPLNERMVDKERLALAPRFPSMARSAAA